MTWAQRLWLVLLVALAAGGTELVWGGLYSGGLGAVILAALFIAALVVAIAERLPTPSPSHRRSPVRTLLGMLAVLLPASIVVSILFHSPTPIIVVVAFGGMALPIVWRLR